MSKAITTIGTLLSIADVAGAVPTNQAAFDVLTYLDLKESVQIGDVGAENSVISYSTTCSGRTSKRMGSTNYGQQGFTLAYDGTNTAHQLLRQKAKDKTVLAVKEVLSDGTQLLYTVYVAMKKIQAGSPTDYLREAVTFEVDSQPIIAQQNLTINAEGGESYNAATNTLTYTSNSNAGQGETLSLVRYTLTFSDPGQPNDGRVIVVQWDGHTDTTPTVSSDVLLTPGQITGNGLSWSVTPDATNKIAVTGAGTITTEIYVEDTGGANDGATI